RVRVVTREPVVRPPRRAPRPQLDALRATGPRPLDLQRIGRGQPGVEPGIRPVHAPADAEGALPVPERPQARPPLADLHALGAGALDRDLPALGRGIDEAGARPLLRGDVP